MHRSRRRSSLSRDRRLLRGLPLLVSFASLALLAGACSDEAPPRVGSVEGLSLPPSATVATTLTVQVRVEDQGGRSMEGVRVTFSVTGGGGEVSPSSVATGAGGAAATEWTLGEGAGEQTLRATAGEHAATLRLQAEPGPPARLSVVSGGDQLGTVGQPAPAEVRLRLEDRHENPIPGRTVTFTPRTDHGTASPAEATTDAQGIAAATWTLGGRAGEQWIDVSAAGVPTASVRATARASSPSEVTVVSGDAQRSRVGTALRDPLVVEVRDAFGNPIAASLVTFEPAPGGGAADPSPAATDDLGRASATWTLGPTAGSWNLEAEAEGIADPVTFQAQALPGVPDQVAAVSGDGQTGFAGAPLGEPVVVRVTDASGNPVPFQPVRFQDPAGGGAADPASTATDAQGRASTTWILGGATGAHALEAAVGDLPPLGFTATATGPAPAQVEKVAGDGQTAEVGSALSQAVEVRALDASGAGVPGAAVEVAVTAGGGSVGNPALLTDATGAASTTWTLGPEAGTQTLEVRVEHAAAPAEFTADATPGPATALAVVSGDLQSALPGEPLADPVVVRARDAFGNGVAGVTVGFGATAGGGSVSPSSVDTDGAGLASAVWTLGAQPGSNTLEATAGGLGVATFTAVATSGTPTTLEQVSGDGQSGPVATRLPEPVRVRVLDEAGQPLEGASVELVVTGGGGSASPATVGTDAAGEASAAWDLGPAAGDQTLEARVDGIAGAAIFAAVADPGPPEGVAVVAGQGQTGTPGAELPEPFVVRVTDAHGNGVPGATVAWTVLQGNGATEAASSVTDEGGRAETRYTFGNSFGEERVAAEVSGVGQVVFRALVGDNLTLTGLYVTQSIQTLDGSVPLVAGRDGVLRVFVRAGSANAYSPDVEVRIYDHGALVQTHLLEAGEDSVRTELDEGSLEASWNLALPGSVIQDGLAVEAEVDPANQIGEVDETDNAFPAGGAPFVPEVRELPDFRVRLVPIHIQSLGTTGDVTEANKDDWMADVFGMMPMPGYDAVVREVYTGDITDPDDFTEWGKFLGEMEALRVAEDPTRYHYGVLAQSLDAPFCGLGYLGVPSAIGMDNCGASTAAHEWGHNWDRLHAPCGGPGGVDPNYPYSGATLGAWGMDVGAGELRDPVAFRDLMSYCSPEWVSDYTYEGVMEFREVEAAQGGPLLAAAEPSLIVWGRVGAEGAVLEPVFEAVTSPRLPVAEGPYRVRGLSADGRTLFSLSFAGHAVDHLPGDERHFAFAVPAATARPAELDRLVLEAPGLPAAVRARSAPLVAGAPEPRALREGAGRVRITWSAAQAPLVVVRNPATGAILSFARGGSALVLTDAPELELELAAGVGTARRVVPVR